MAAVLTEQDVDTFHDRGVVLVKAAFPPALASELVAMLWEDLARRRPVRRQDPDTWGTAPWTGFKGVATHPRFSALATPRLGAAIDALLSPSPWRYRKTIGAILAGPPVGRPGSWRPTARTWHFDGALGGPGLTFFAILAPLAPREGGTLLLEGSHHLVDDFAHGLSADERRLPHDQLHLLLIEKYSVIRELARREPLDPSSASFEDGRRWEHTELRVRDVSGEPGDVLLCKLNLLHSPPTYVGPRPRFLVKGETV